jgi:Lon protease-like protein
MLVQDSNIPLFPLNVVLFPGMMLPLHVFEDRYKIMIRECLAEGQPFGVVLAKDTPQTDDPFAEFYPIGTTARITAVEHLKDGRMNLITIGQDRFVIKECYQGKDDFFIGQVDPFPLADEHRGDTLEQMTTTLRTIMQRYILHLAEASGEDLSGAVIPTDPIALAFLAGTAIQGPLWSRHSDKQTLLEIKSLRALIAKTIHILDKEDKLLTYMLQAYHTHEQVERLPFVDYSLN